MKLGNLRFLDSSKDGKIQIKNLNGKTRLEEDEKGVYEKESGFSCDVSYILGGSHSESEKGKKNRGTVYL